MQNDMILGSHQLFLKTIGDEKIVTYKDNPDDRTLKELRFEIKLESGWLYDLPYDIRLGGIGFSSYLSDYGNDMEYIRHSIENYVYTGEAKIELCFEDSPTTIFIKRAPVRDESVDPCEDRFVARVYISPNEFVEDGYKVVAFCEERQVIKELYETLLNVGRYGYRYGKDIGSRAWGYPPMTFYNKIKSPIIEDFITGKKRKDDEAMTRQVTIDHILTIDEDYGAFLWDEHGIGNGDVDSNDIIEFEFDNDDNDYRIHVPGIYRWNQAAFNPAEFPEYRVNDKFDVDKWYGQELALAKVIRRSLPPNIDLWCCHPYEDVVHRWKRQVLIYRE